MASYIWSFLGYPTEEKIIHEKSAVLIQKIYKGYLVKRRFTTLKNIITKIENKFITYKEQQKLVIKGKQLEIAKNIVDNIINDAVNKKIDDENIYNLIKDDNPVDLISYNSDYEIDNNIEIEQSIIYNGEHIDYSQILMDISDDDISDDDISDNEIPEEIIIENDDEEEKIKRDDVFDKLWFEERRKIIKQDSFLLNRNNAAKIIQRGVRNYQKYKLLNRLYAGAAIVGYNKLCNYIYLHLINDESKVARDRRYRIIKIYKKINRDNLLKLWDIDTTNQKTENNSYRKCIDDIIKVC
jgi:hypothetical protein